MIKQKSNANKLAMNYQGTGRNYKISEFGQYATGFMIDCYEYSSIRANNPPIPDRTTNYKTTTYPQYTDNKGKF
ncbi:hypothetical protein [Mesomycoplasma ovipneumoniae]|uniref:hypothetical protein n=1 Tax=Mesomycoplasma ovipneumoniae TaxID=29562 RepID=UPI0029641660|nr:hypothetical protein [Mesomycoplasma ovipneumoniae]MDW2923182.1 hypothetical protein [Mesomycoplasma ovipneumoniae]